MIINEEFFDDNNVEQTDQDLPEYHDTQPDFHIVQTINFPNFSSNNDIIRELKRIVNFILYSPSLSNTSIDRIEILIFMSRKTPDFSHIDRDSFPKDIMGIPLILTINPISAPNHLMINSTVEFNADVRFNTPRDFMSFMNILATNDGNPKTTDSWNIIYRFIDVYPQTDPKSGKIKYDRGIYKEWAPGRYVNVNVTAPNKGFDPETITNVFHLFINDKEFLRRTIGYCGNIQGFDTGPMQPFIA